MYFLCFIFSKVEIIPIQNKTIKHTYLKVCKERERECILSNLYKSEYSVFVVKNRTFTDIPFPEWPIRNKFANYKSANRVENNFKESYFI
jgi:hypothetical protein